MADWPSINWLRMSPPSTEVPEYVKPVGNWLRKTGSQLVNTDYSWAHEPVKDIEWLPDIPNAIVKFPEIWSKAVGRTAERWRDAASPALDYMWNGMFTPISKMKEIETETAAAANEGAAAPTQPEGGVTTASSSHNQPTGEFKLGSRFVPIPPPTIEAPQYPMPPDQPAPAARPERTPFDFQPYLDKMYAYEPEDLDRRQYMKERLLANLSRAFAAGASGSGWSGGAGAIARFGSGFGMGQADTTDAFLAEQAGIDEQQRQFGLDRLGLEMKLAQEADNIAFENQQTQWQNAEDVRQNTIANDAQRYNVLTKNIAETAQVNQQNADRFWQYQNEVGDRFDTKILPGTGKGNIVMDTTDAETGERTLKYINLTDDTMGGLYDAEDINKLQDIVALKGEDAPEYQQFLMAPALASMESDNGLQVKRVIAEQAIRTGGLEELGIDLESIQQEASQIVGQQGVAITDDTAWTKAMQRAIAFKVAEQLDLKNLDSLGILASHGNYGAQLLLQVMQRQTAPTGGVAGGQQR